MNKLSFYVIKLEKHSEGADLHQAAGLFNDKISEIWHYAESVIWIQSPQILAGKLSEFSYVHFLTDPDEI